MPPRGGQHRPREGCEGRYMVSIHAPTRGATVPGLPVVLELRVSIHAPTRGATAVHHIDLDFRPVSIHAPTRGATK